MTLRPLFYSDKDCRDRLKPGKPMFFNVYRLPGGELDYGMSRVQREVADITAMFNRARCPYRIVVKAKPTPSPEKEDAA